MILVILGVGTICQVALSSNTDVSPSPKGVSYIPLVVSILLIVRQDWLSMNFGMAIGDFDILLSILAFSHSSFRGRYGRMD